MQTFGFAQGLASQRATQPHLYKFISSQPIFVNMLIGLALVEWSGVLLVFWCVMCTIIVAYGLERKLGGLCSFGGVQ